MRKNFSSPKKYSFKTPVRYVYKTKPGLNRNIVLEISEIKGEPNWMRQFRLDAYEIFIKKPLPNWGVDLKDLNFKQIVYFVRPTEKRVHSWQEVPKEIKETYRKIGLPQAERKFLAGVTAQYDSEVVYEKTRKILEKQGVIFCDLDLAIKKYPQILKKYFGQLVPPNDNKFAALNSCVWSGGSFVYVPQGVKVKLPLQAYFRINFESFGQFERTLIIAEPGSFVHYLEGCTAPFYSTYSLHAAVVEIFVKPKARVRYTTIQNWSNNVYNLVTKRAKVEKEAIMEWVDCNLGSKTTMKYPSFFLTGEKAKGEVLSISWAGKNQHQDTGAKMIHLAPQTSSRIISKSISKDGGWNSYRGLVKITPSASRSVSYVSCQALILDEKSKSNTYPVMQVNSQKARVEHEAKVEKISEEKLFFLTSRGIKKEEAEGLLVNGFIEPIVKELPLEYAIELNQLISLEMEKSLG